MKVTQLIELLQQQDTEKEVRIAVNANDYWRTTLALGVKNIDEGNVKRSDYHNCDVIDDDDDRLDNAVVVISPA